jgi:hypothetical protein
LGLHAIQPARAVPSYAAQTGQPCTACHIGGFGPQLTPFGRAFKIGGYTLQGGQGLASKIPLAGFTLSSFTNTNSSLPEPPFPHYGRNNNFAMDQISAFLAGRFTDFAGSFVQGTFSGVTSAFSLDNTDVRFTTPLTVFGSELRIGASVNNGPTVQDPYNSTFVWGFPFATSPFAPTPTAQPLFAGGLVGNSAGLSLYLWYDRRLLIEAGGYGSYPPTLLKITGTTLGPGSTNNLAPYLRVAYEWNWSGQSAHLGGLFLNANLKPAISERAADGSFGLDRYTDYAIDGGYQFLGDGTHIGTLDFVFTHEDEDLQGSFNMGSASQPANKLNQILANISYWFQNTYGITFGWQNTWGTPNPARFAPAPVTGSRNGKPNSNAFIIEADWVPFGKADSWGSPFANLKLGVQYIAYTRFNGGTGNYDGFGRNASGNNTLYVYLWTEF